MLLYRRSRHAGLAGMTGILLVLLAGGTAAAAPVPATSPFGPNVVRSCAAPVRPGDMTCFALLRTDTPAPQRIGANLVPNGYGPVDLQTAYHLPTTRGAGMTVAIVDAYDDPNAESDLTVYRTQYNLPACTTANGCFEKVNQSGSSSPLPTADVGWASEISLDLDMVSAACPLCHILLVEANSAAGSDLLAAVDTAAARTTFVSNSYGGTEFNGETGYDSHLFHPGVAIVYATGDSGYDAGAQYPATSPYVIAVGGTSLSRDAGTGVFTESAWAYAGSGCSAYEPRPSWQNSTFAAHSGCTRRAEADVSAVADIDTPVAVYDSYGKGGWLRAGGTSAAAPLITGIYALGGTPPPSDNPAIYPYAAVGTVPGSLLDITTGTNGTCGAVICTGGAGWDGPTGWGTPNGNAAFVSQVLWLAGPGPQAGPVGTFGIAGSQARGGLSPYQWTANGLPGGLSIDPATGLISGVLSQPGSFVVTISVTDQVSHSASTAFGWTVTTTVPNLTGLRFTPAAQALAAAGLRVGTVTNVPDPLCESIGKVKFQSPGQGVQVPGGTAVDLSFGVRTGPCA